MQSDWITNSCRGCSHSDFYSQDIQSRWGQAWKGVYSKKYQLCIHSVNTAQDIKHYNVHHVQNSHRSIVTNQKKSMWVSFITYTCTTTKGSDISPHHLRAHSSPDCDATYNAVQLVTYLEKLITWVCAGIVCSIVVFMLGIPISYEFSEINRFHVYSECDSDSHVLPHSFVNRGDQAVFIFKDKASHCMVECHSR